MLSLPRLPLLAVLLGGIVHAQNPPPAPPEARQFDFWIGTWEVSAQGKVVGRNQIESIHNGRVLHESYTTNGAFAGNSYNSYNVGAKRWEQFWIDNSGTVLHITGGLNEAGQMVLSGERTGPQGKEITDRITWTPNEDGTVRQHWEVSSDEGANWQTAFDGTYRRLEAGEDDT